MNTEISYFLLCDNFITEADTKKRSIINSFDFYKLADVPQEMPSFFVVFRLLGASKVKNVSIKILNPSREHVLAETQLSREGEEDSLNVFVKVVGLKISEYGSHPIDVYTNEEKISSRPEQHLLILKP
jgi:hypothetical protein